MVELDEDRANDVVNENAREITARILGLWLQQTRELGDKNVAVSQVAFIKGMADAMAIFLEMGRRMVKDEKQNQFPALIESTFAQYIREAHPMAVDAINELELITEQKLNQAFEEITKRSTKH